MGLGDPIFDDDLFGSPKKKNSNRDTRRKFTGSQENEIWDRQNGKCVGCKKALKRSATHFDHKKPWSDGGKTVVSNGQALCTECHAIKTNKERLKKVDKKRTKKKHSDPVLGDSLF